MNDVSSVENLIQQDYQHGFITEIEADNLPPGVNEDIIRAISAKKNEPEFMLEWRLKAYRHWLTLTEPHWANAFYPPIDYQKYIYYAAPKPKKVLNSLDEVDPKVREEFEKLGISLNEQKRLSGVAVDAVMDSASVATTFREELSKQGIIFCSFSEAVREYPNLVREHLGSVVPVNDNY